MSDPDVLIRELNHRVKNNFQIILSLMNLKKRMMPLDRRDDIRFIEEHVQSMSVAYRLVYATGSIADVSLSDLITEVLAGLRQIAGVSEDKLRVETSGIEAAIGLDQGIALALYLAVLLPPYFDEASDTAGTVVVTVAMAATEIVLTVNGSLSRSIVLDVLRSRLMQAYAMQLQAQIFPATTHGSESLRFELSVSTPPSGPPLGPPAPPA